MPDTIRIIKVAAQQAELLLELSRRTFFEAFAHLNNPADMEAYATQAFTLQKFQQELNNIDSTFYFVYAGDELAGYLKLNLNTAQTEFQGTDALEVERIYICQQHQGKKIGKLLIGHALQTAIDNNLKQVWLGVWEHNTNAIRFYEANGFAVFSSHPFVLGTDKQTDLLMRRYL